MFGFIFLFLLWQNPVQDSGWILKKDQAGIAIYTREVTGSSFAEFKAITEIKNSSLDKVLDVVLDVENYDRLFPDCANPKKLKQEGKYNDIHYIEALAPWPVSNRDAVYEQKTIVSENGKKARVNLKPIPNYIPEKNGLLRIQKGTGFWELEETELHHVKITYQFHGEPGGAIPGWLANSFVVDHPFKTLQNLLKLLKNEK
jgi:hypothetical protein